MTISTLRLKPPTPLRVLDDLDVDAIIFELDTSGQLLDWRIELGRGLEMFWLLPIEPRGRVRLIFRGYVTCDDDPEVWDDPCHVDLGPLEWAGEIAPGYDHGYRALLLRFEMKAAPASYRCFARVRHADGRVADYEVAYEEVVK